MRSCNRAGFTLIELLVVIAIVMILAALMFPVFGRVQEHAKKVRARAECREIETAWKAYLSDYRTWGTAPNSGSMGDAEVRWLIGNPALGGNPKGIMYLEINPSTLVGGAFVDPWKRPYRFLLDDNYDNTCDTPWGEQVSKSVAVWSMGKDGAENTGDDVKGW